VTTVVRLARVLLLLALAGFVVVLVIALASSGTGAIEKLVLAVVIAGCVLLAAKLSSFTDRASALLQRH
jgi:glycine cleavage system regulatory protein